MQRMQVKSLFLVLFVGMGTILTAQTSSTKITVAVGNCQPQLVSYSTISEAVAAVKKNSTVLVCPGTYPEQVTITQSLTLTGLADEYGNIPIIAVPSGGLVSVYGQATQIFVGGVYPPVGSVNMSNLVVDGTGSGIDCSTGATLIGIFYQQVTVGSLNNVEVRDQNPGGCGFGIWLQGSDFGSKINIRNSYVHDFDNTGIFAEDGANGQARFPLYLRSNSVVSASTSVQAGVAAYGTVGVAEHNIIDLASGTGLLLASDFATMHSRWNTVTGASVGIFAEFIGGTTYIVGNRLSNNGTGIATDGHGSGAVIKSNSIIQSAVTAIELACNQDSEAEDNIISDAPVGIADIVSGAVVKGNHFSDVTTPTTTCPSQSPTREHQP
ncbi:MAG: right-handed parallel beta-helix repeat-containing protein [Terriglobales bacterium]